MFYLLSFPWKLSSNMYFNHDGNSPKYEFGTQVFILTDVYVRIQIICTMGFAYDTNSLRCPSCHLLREDNVFTGVRHSVHRRVGYLWCRVPFWSLVPCPFWGTLPLGVWYPGGRISIGRLPRGIRYPGVGMGGGRVSRGYIPYPLYLPPPRNGDGVYSGGRTHLTGMLSCCLL